jgi:hypothetical protein
MNTKLKIIVFLLLVLGVSQGFAENVTVLDEITNPEMIKVAGDNLYVLEGPVVHIYSLKENKLLHSFGKRGEGPGELMLNPQFATTLHAEGDNVIVTTFNKMIYFSKEGKLIKEITFKNIALQIVPFGKNIAVTRLLFGQGGRSQLAVKLYDTKLKELKTLYVAEYKNRQKLEKVEVPPLFLLVKQVGGKLFVVDQKKGFEIHVFDKTGKELPLIKQNYAAIKYPESYKKKIMDWMRMEPRFKAIPVEVKKMFYFPENLPTIRNLMVDDSKLYVQTYKMADDKSEIFVMDPQGKVLKKTMVHDATRFNIKFNPFNLFCFANGKYYYLNENFDDEEWELHIEELK